MSDEAVFQGIYADWKLVKTRGVVQIVVEVNLEAAGEALKVLGGMPNFASPLYVAVAVMETT